MCETGLTNSSKSLLSFQREMTTKVINSYKRFRFPNCGGKIDGRHILIDSLSEHHVDYMNRKGWSLHYYAGELFHRCVHRMAWTRAWHKGSGKL